MAKRGRMSVEEHVEKREKLFNFLWRRRDAKVGSVQVSELRSNLKVSAAKLEQLLKEIEQLSPRLFSWTDESSIDLRAITYYDERANSNQQLKDRIASVICKQVPAGATLACSAGTTVTSCIRKIGSARRQLFVVTNNVGILELNWGFTSVAIDFIGGQYSAETHSCIGQEAVERFRQLSCRVVLFSVSGINEHGELFVYHPHESPVHSVLATETKSSCVMIVADVTKVGISKRWCFSSLADIHKQDMNRKIILVTNSRKASGLNADRDEEVEAIMEQFNTRFPFVEVHEATDK